MVADTLSNELTQKCDLQWRSLIQQSTTIAQQIRLRLSPDRLDALARRQAHNPEAYDAYLQGRYYWNLFTPATTRKAVECYLRATQLDPNYALAWSGLADAYASSPIQRTRVLAMCGRRHGAQLSRRLQRSRNWRRRRRRGAS